MGVCFRGFSNLGGKFQRFFDFHEGKILGLKKSYGCKKKNLAFFWCKNFWPFFLVQNQDFSGENIFFDLSGSEILDISEFHGCKFWSLFKSGRRKFQRKLKSHGRTIWGLFFLGTLLRRG